MIDIKLDDIKIGYRYSEIIKIQKVGNNLYMIEELDKNKGYRVSTINSRTGKTILEKIFGINNIKN